VRGASKGRFSFAIWDGATNNCFARGIISVSSRFTYVQREIFFINTQHAELPSNASGGIDELNEAAIGDFLLFGLNYDNATTSFRDIQRLPPAHSLSSSPEG